MRIGDVLYFAPNFKLYQLRTASSKQIVGAFEARISDYYFDAAEILNKSKKGFAAGDICFDAIDAIAKYEVGGSVGYRFKKWISRLPDFKNLTWEQLERVYDDFRNGVTHEARVKNGGQFTYEIAKAVHFEDDIVVINPELLLQQIRKEFGRQMTAVKSDEKKTERLANAIRSDFKKDLEKLPN